MHEKKVNRKYKDRLFRILFSEKEEAIKLFNAINGTEYDCVDDVIVNTLEQGLFIEGENDLSFIVMDLLNMYEHQSTYNPNMPLRYLEYIQHILKEYIILKKETLFSSTKVKLPQPRFIVFYNGEKEMPERWENRLSELYIRQTDTPELELTVLTLNINRGYNEEIKRKCPLLREYCRFIELIREYKRYMSLKEAVEKAREQSIEENVLKEFLLRHGGDDIMSILEIGEEELSWVLRDERRIGEEQGKEIGKEIGKEENTVEIIKNMLLEKMDISIISRMVKKSREYIQKIQDEM